MLVYGSIPDSFSTFFVRSCVLRTCWCTHSTHVLLTRLVVMMPCNVFCVLVINFREISLQRKILRSTDLISIPHFFKVCSNPYKSQYIVYLPNLVPWKSTINHFLFRAKQLLIFLRSRQSQEKKKIFKFLREVNINMIWYKSFTHTDQMR